MERNALLEAQKELLASGYSQAQAYTNLIILAGYAGFFAVWTTMRDRFTDATVFASGLLIALSISGFIIWEIYAMILRSRALLGIGRAVSDPSNFERLIMEHARNERNRHIAYVRTWVVVLVFVVTTGFGGVAIVISAFIHGLWHATVA